MLFAEFLKTMRTEIVNRRQLQLQSIISAPKKRSKYGVRHDAQGKEARIADGILFDSKRECQRYCTLRTLEKVGKIQWLRMQVEFVLNVNGIRVGKYICDFMYFDCESGKTIVEDVKTKATITPAAKIKLQLMKALYDIDVLITG